MTINEKLPFPQDPTNLSPALAAMVAMITMPVQYASIMAKSALSVNAKCKSRTVNIGK